MPRGRHEKVSHCRGPCEDVFDQKESDYGGRNNTTQHVRSQCGLGQRLDTIAVIEFENILFFSNILNANRSGQVVFGVALDHRTLH